MMISNAAAVAARRKPCHSSIPLTSFLFTVDSKIGSNVNVIASRHRGILLRSFLSTTATTTTTATTESALQHYHDNQFRYESSEKIVWKFATGLMGCLMMAVASTSLATAPASCESVVVDPPAAVADTPTTNNNSDENVGEVEEASESSLSEEQQQKPQQNRNSYDPLLLKQISLRILQMERWLGDLIRDPQLLQRYQAAQQHQQQQSFNRFNLEMQVDATMSKPDLLLYMAKKLIDVNGWGTSPDLIQLVVEYLEVAGLQKYAKEELATMCHLLRTDSLVLRGTGPCLPLYRALYECLMLQPTDSPDEKAAGDHLIRSSIDFLVNIPNMIESSAVVNACPLHAAMMEKCLEENENLVKLIQNQRDFDEMMHRGLFLPWMIETAEKVLWTKPPFSLDWTTWRHYVQVKGWKIEDLKMRLQAEQQWRIDTFASKTSPPGQSYWVHLQNEWTDVPVVTLELNLPRVDPATGYRLVKAWVSDAGMPQREQQEQDAKQQQELILGFVDGKPSELRRRGQGTKIQIPISILPGRTESIQVHALYVEYISTGQGEKTRLYYTAPLSLVTPLL